VPFGRRCELPPSSNSRASVGLLAMGCGAFPKRRGCDVEELMQQQFACVQHYFSPNEDLDGGSCAVRRAECRSTARWPPAHQTLPPARVGVCPPKEPIDRRLT